MNKTVTFQLNPCEYILYWDSTGAPRTCEPRISLGLCSKLPDMGDKIEDAFEWWTELAPEEDALTFIYDGILGGVCPETVGGCPEVDGWKDDTDWVITRTYQVEDNPVLCDDAAGPAMTAGGALRFFNDSGADHTTRSIRECDIVFPGRAWDTAADHPCRLSGLYNITECQGATTLGLVHEIGHCVGFGHSYLTRRSLDPLALALDGLGLELLEGLPSMMAYDHVGQVDTFNTGMLNLAEQALYLYTYAVDADQGSDDHFAAYGTVVTDADNDCTPLTNEQPIFGAAVIALEATSTTVKPVHVSMTGVHPLGAGAFRLDHLDRSKDYRLIVVDARDENQLLANGWEFDTSEGGVPALPAIRTDLWDETHAGNAYKYEMSAQFATGFAPKVTAQFDGPDAPDDEEFVDPICVEF